MPDNSINNKRLAKNTVFLYVRMLILMVITLYTSRVTLQVLGVDDFGIYNIVGGVVVLFSFLSTALNSACNRYFSVAVGKNDTDELQRTFSTSLVAHVVLTAIVALILETVGLWFVANKLNIPEGRESVVLIIYHIAVLSVCFNVIRTPFSSSIVAHERMDFYAYTSIVEGFLKLAIVWILMAVPFDKLVSYSILMMLSILFINIWYIWYCVSKFDGNRMIFKADRTFLHEMLVFSGWNLFGGIADLGWQQGTNIILNIFYGVALNATMGITNQVRNAIYSFVINLQMAANPQIIKAYGNKDYPHYHALINAISKYSYYLMLLFAIPLIVNMDFILKLWLGVPPESSTIFCDLILVFSTIGALGGPLWVAIQATGDVKKYSIVVSCFLLLNLPATYFLFALNQAPETMLWARIVIQILCYSWILLYVRQKVNHSISTYLKDVVLPIILVTLIASTPAYLLYTTMTPGWLMLISSTGASIITLCIAIYTVGMRNSERAYLKTLIANKLNRNK